MVEGSFCGSGQYVQRSMKRLPGYDHIHQDAVVNLEACWRWGEHLETAVDENGGRAGAWGKKKIILAKMGPMLFL